MELLPTLVQPVSTMWKRAINIGPINIDARKPQSTFKLLWNTCLLSHYEGKVGIKIRLKMADAKAKVVVVVGFFLREKAGLDPWWTDGALLTWGRDLE